MPWQDDLLDVLLPTACLCCGAPAGAHAKFRRICNTCATALPTTLWPLAEAPAFINCAWALAPYEGVAGELIRTIKYGRHPGLLDEVAAHLARAANGALPAVDLVTWVPSSPKRNRTRGFTPAEQLARAVGIEIQRPIKELLRLDDGPALASLTAPARKAILKGRLHVTPTALPPAVLVVDDVLTTGSTLSACARRLLNTGARGVYAVTWAATTR